MEGGPIVNCLLPISVSLDQPVTPSVWNLYRDSLEFVPESQCSSCFVYLILIVGRGSWHVYYDLYIYMVAVSGSIFSTIKIYTRMMTF